MITVQTGDAIHDSLPWFRKRSPALVPLASRGDTIVSG